MNNEHRKVGRALTVRSLVIGSVGSIFITTSSLYIALKMSSLPWPIIFVALASMFSLKSLGQTNFGEINVTHTAMSAGAMVAGGLAFTIPGILILHPGESLNFRAVMVCSVGGTVLGLIFTALIRKYFIEEKGLDYPMGEAAAETLYAGDEGGRKSRLLFGTMGFSMVFTWLRDRMALFPATVMSKTMGAYGSSCGFYFSPMLIGIGYILGPALLAVWFFGAVLGDGVILFLGQKLGFYDLATATAIKSSLGVGLMVGTGLGILLKGILPKAKEIALAAARREESVLSGRWMIILAVVAAAAFTYFCNLGPAASVLVILGTWFATAMSAECVGQTGINPMEIFGILILLFVRMLTSVGETEAFYIAAIVAVAAGLTGDVMNDFRAGHIMKTPPKDQWIGEAVGGLIGSVTAVFALYMILRAYGSEAIGGELFPAAQAATVASMVGGISHLPAFIIGIVAAAILYMIGFPVMTLGLGVYLPSYMSLTAALGGLLRWLVGRFRAESEEKGTIIASGFLGGEGITGVAISFLIAFGMM